MKTHPRVVLHTWSKAMSLCPEGIKVVVGRLGEIVVILAN